MAKFIEVTDHKYGPVIINVDQIEAVHVDGPHYTFQLSSGGIYTVIENYSTIKRKLIPVEEPVHSGPGG
jgi:uncharacterized protein YlzI (FlbEa/FlbD family)